MSSKKITKKPNKNLIEPDKFVLDKSEMLRLFERVQNHWKRDDFSMMQNLEYTALTETTKLAIRGTDLDVLQTIWFSLNQFIAELQTLNTLKANAIENPSLEKLYTMEWYRIESGEAFIGN